MSINFDRLSRVYSEQLGTSVQGDEIRDWLSDFAQDPKASRCITSLYESSERTLLQKSAEDNIDKIYSCLDPVINISQKDLKDRVVKQINLRAGAYIEECSKSIASVWGYSTMADRLMVIYKLNQFSEQKNYRPSAEETLEFIKKVSLTIEKEKNHTFPLVSELTTAILKAAGDRMKVLVESQEFVLDPILKSVSERAEYLVKKAAVQEKELKDLPKKVAELREKAHSNSANYSLEQLLVFRKDSEILESKINEFDKLNKEIEKFRRVSIMAQSTGERIMQDGFAELAKFTMQAFAQHSPR